MPLLKTGLLSGHVRSRVWNLMPDVAPVANHPFRHPEEGSHNVASTSITSAITHGRHRFPIHLNGQLRHGLPHGHVR